MNKKTENRFEDFNFKSWLITILGGIIFFGGILIYFFTSPRLGMSLRYLQPKMLDGSLILILGLGLLIFGIYRLKNAKKIFQDKIDFEKEIEERENLKRRRSMGYKK